MALDDMAYSAWTACQVAHYRRKGDVLNALHLLRGIVRTTQNPRLVKLAQYGIRYHTAIRPDSQILEFPGRWKGDSC